MYNWRAGGLRVVPFFEDSQCECQVGIAYLGKNVLSFLLACSVSDRSLSLNSSTIPVPSFEQGPHSNSHVMSQCEDFETSRDTSVTTGIFLFPYTMHFSSRKVHEHVDRGYYIRFTKFDSS